MARPVSLTAFLLQLLYLCNVLAYDKVQCPKVPAEVTNSTYFLFYFGPTVNDYYRCTFEDGLSISQQQSFNKNIETVLYLPGWGEKPSQHEESTDTIAAAFLDAKVANLIIVDYANLVKNQNLFEYVSSVGNITSIGEELACFLQKFVPSVQAIEYIHLVGHSLGGQIISQISKAYGQGKIVHATALDPAGPLFNIPFIEHSLSKKDAKFVDVIHTDANFYGEGRACGHVDFWPNKGTRIQPYCVKHDYQFCSHHMSWRYYAASVKQPTIFPAQQCDMNPVCLFFSPASCCKENAVVAYMGYGVNKMARNDFYLETSDEYPYGLGVDGFYTPEQ